MRRAEAAERLLALFTTPEHAAAVVGDLLEMHGGGARFWRAVLGATGGQARRFGLGLLGAALVECFWLYTMKWHWTGPDWAPYAADQQGHIQLNPTYVASIVSWTLLAVAAVFAAIRFGVRDAISRLAIALALFGGLGLFFWWAPYLQPASWALAVLVIAASCLTRRGRSALARLLLALAAGAVPMLVALALFLKCVLDFAFSKVPYLSIAYAGMGFVISSSLIAVVLEGLKERKSQLCEKNS